MIKEIYNLADRFIVQAEYNTDDSVSSFIRKEYGDYLTDSDTLLPVIGVINQAETKFNTSALKELVKYILYEDNKYLYAKYNGKYLRMYLTSDSFEITYDKGFENNVAFHYLEVLIRLYAHKYGIDFFHAASFQYDNQVYMLNGFGGSGKTEIMLDFLIKQNAAYISDDIVIVNEDGNIYPYMVSIPVRWNAVTAEFVRKAEIPTAIYHLCSYCKGRNGKITRRIYWKFCWKYILGDYSHKTFTDAPTELQFYKVDNCIWLQEANFAGDFEFPQEKFFRYMNLCLENESRKYCDIEGFLQLKFPIVAKLKKARFDFRKNICQNYNIRAIAVKNRNFNNVAKTLSQIN